MATDADRLHTVGDMPNAHNLSPVQADANRAPPVTSRHARAPDVFVAALLARHFAGTSPIDVNAPSPRARTPAQLTQERHSDSATTNREPALIDEVNGSDEGADRPVRA